jgi:hypothetical protein
MVTTANHTISIPIEISLSEEGDDFFLKNSHRMDTFQVLKGKGAGAHRLSGFNPTLIQNLLTYSFIKKVSLVLDDLLPNRNDVVDISKLLIYGMSYRQFADDALQLVLQSEPLAVWNRRNPKQRIDAGNCRGKAFSSFLEKRRDEKEALRNVFLKNSLPAFLQNKAPEEQKKILTIGKRFLNGLDSFTWFFLLSYRNSSGWSDLFTEISGLLELHLNRVSFIEYSALVIVELLQQIELDSMRSAASILYGTHANVDILFQSKKHVAALKQHRLDHGGGTHLSFSFDRRQSGKGLRNRIKITMAGKDASYRKLNKRVHESLRGERQGKDLFAYYEEGNELGILGFHYLHFLKEACKQWGIRFDSFVNHIDEGDFTVIHLVLDL